MDKLRRKKAVTVYSYGGDTPMMEPNWFRRSDGILGRNEAVFGAVSKLSNIVAAQTLRLYKGHDIVWDHPLAKVFYYRPSSGYTPFTFWQTMEACRGSTGNCYACLVPGVDGIESADPLDPERVEPMREKSTGEVWFRYTPDGSPALYLPERIVLHSRYIASVGDKGISPMAVLAPAMRYADQMREFSLQQVRGVSDAVVLELPGHPGEARTQESVETFKRHYKSSGIIVLTGGAKASTVKRNITSGSVLELDRLNVNQVARVMSMPPVMLGDYSSKSYGSQEQQQLEFLADTLTPIDRMYKDELEAKTLTWNLVRQGYHWEWDMSALQMVDAITRANVDQMHVRNGIATLNQAKQRNGYKPVPGGDRTYISGDLRPLDAEE